METLPNKNDIIKYFENNFDEIINLKDCKITDLSMKIKNKMLEIGSKILESWFVTNIGNGYQGCKIKKEINGNVEDLRFYNHLEKTYFSCLGEIKLKRSYYQNSNTGCFPIEEEYQWLKDEFLPDIKEISCYASMLEPYDMASKMLEKIGCIKISPSSLQKITKTIGTMLVEKEDEIQKKNIFYEKPIKDIDLLVISYDGTCIKTKEDWKEVKTGAVYEIKKDKKNEIHAINKSYISRIENCKDFGKRIYEESRRRHLGYAKQIVTIGDGAKWIWEISNNYYPKSIEIVDWYHATEHLWEIIEFIFGSRGSENGIKFEEKCENLLYNGLIFLLEKTITDKMIELKIKQNTERYKSIIRGINYFKNNEQRMKYSDYEDKGLPIGSGVIEGACKHLVQLRMKRTGMKWSILGAHCILQLRCLFNSDRWNEVEDVIENAAYGNLP